MPVNLDQSSRFLTQGSSGMQRADGGAGDSGPRIVVEGHPDGDADPEGDQDGRRGE
jgi:hypothetical protein